MRTLGYTTACVCLWSLLGIIAVNTGLNQIIGATMAGLGGGGTLLFLFLTGDC